MPRQLVHSKIPVDLSIIEFDLDAGEEIFLTYTWERQEGPAIKRTGEGPPYMDLLSTRQKPQEPAELRQFILDIQHDMTDEIEAMAEAGLEGAPKRFLKGIGC